VISATFYSVLYFLIVLGVLVFIHEFGHFLLAKKLGVGVLTFSLGFGPKLIGRKIGETQYQVSAVPLGIRQSHG
jgi:regulator of sigma E protease